MDRVYFEIPTFCPECNSILVEEGQFLFCKSKACPAKLSGSVRVWVEKLGLLHWGDSLIDNLTDPADPKINSVADLYKLTIKDIASCCSGEKFAKKCYDQLHAQKDVPIQLMLSALNISFLGPATANDIVASGLNSIDKLLFDATIEDFLKVPNIGEITAKKIYDGIQERKPIILALNSAINIVGSADGPLSGKSMCITGTLSKPRKAIEKMIMDRGGVVKGSVGMGLSYLITNDSNTTSSKMKNAQKYGVQVITEKDLYTMIGV